MGQWRVSAQMMGETIPKENSTVYLDPHLTDKYGIPQLHISVGYDENDEKMLNDFFQQFAEMFEHAGFSGILKKRIENEHLAMKTTKWAVFAWVKTLKHPF